LCEQFADYAVCGGDFGPFFTWSLELVGTDQFLLTLRDRPEVANGLLTRVADYYYQTTRRRFEVAGDKIDIFYIGDDYSTQRCPFVHLRD
jgi:uroporphyrinogen decarboxylase